MVGTGVGESEADGASVAVGMGTTTCADTIDTLFCLHDKQNSTNTMEEIWPPLTCGATVDDFGERKRRLNAMVKPTTFSLQCRGRE